MRLLDVFVLGGLSLSLMFFMACVMASMSVQQEYGHAYEHVEEDVAIFWANYFPEQSRAYGEYLGKVDSAWSWLYLSISASVLTLLPALAISRRRKQGKSF